MKIFFYKTLFIFELVKLLKKFETDYLIRSKKTNYLATVS